MRALFSPSLALWLLVLAPFSAAAGDFDGSTPLLCALNEVMECAPAKGCQRILPEEAGAPDFFLIDVAAMSVSGLGGVSRVSAIDTAKDFDGGLILQGAEEEAEAAGSSLGWSAAITQDSGRVVLSASGDGVAFVVFGACAALTGR